MKGDGGPVKIGGRKSEKMEEGRRKRNNKIEEESRKKGGRKEMEVNGGRGMHEDRGREIEEIGRVGMEDE